MHELSVTKSILDIVLKQASQDKVNKILTIHLMIGELNDLEGPWIQHYFDYLSKGTLAEGAQIMVETVPMQMECLDCHNQFPVYQNDYKDIHCQACGNKNNLKIISGNEFLIKNMEVQ